MVFIFPVLDNGVWKFKNEVFVCVMEENENQESSVNVALLEFCLQAFAKAHSNITKAWIKSDNAGTYHCEMMIKCLWSLSIQKKFHQLQVLGYKYSTAGAGKDRYV